MRHLMVRHVAAGARRAVGGGMPGPAVDLLTAVVEELDLDELEELRLRLDDLRPAGCGLGRCARPASFLFDREPLPGEWDGAWDDAVRLVEGG